MQVREYHDYLTGRSKAFTVFHLFEALIINGMKREGMIQFWRNFHAHVSCTHKWVIKLASVLPRDAEFMALMTLIGLLLVLPEGL